jgi:anti-sigma factor RsiW
VANNDRSAHVASLDNMDDAKFATMHAIVRRDRKRAIVLAAIKGEALARRPDGCPGRRCARVAARTLVGAKEWSVS